MLFSNWIGKILNSYRSSAGWTKTYSYHSILLLLLFSLLLLLALFLHFSFSLYFICVFYTQQYTTINIYAVVTHSCCCHYYCCRCCCFYCYYALLLSRIFKVYCQCYRCCCRCCWLSLVLSVLCLFIVVCFFLFLFYLRFVLCWWITSQNVTHRFYADMDTSICNRTEWIDSSFAMNRTNECYSLCYVRTVSNTLSTKTAAKQLKI